MSSMYESGSVHVDGSLSADLNVQVIAALNSPQFNASDKIVLVVGSGTPWLEESTDPIK